MIKLLNFMGKTQNLENVVFTMKVQMETITEVINERSLYSSVKILQDSKIFLKEYLGVLQPLL